MAQRGHVAELLDGLYSFTLSRRQLLKRAAVAGLTVPAITTLLSACADDDDDTDSPIVEPDDDDEMAPDDDDADEPVDDDDDEEVTGVLRVGLPIEPDILDPHVGSSRYDTVVNRMVYDTLIFLTNDGEFVPFLATNWDITEDGLTRTFELRDDVVFHDGTPFTAEVMKFSFDRMVAPETQSQASRGQMGPYSHSEVVDDHTIEVTFESPYAAFLTYASGASLSPVSPAAVEEHGDAYGTNPAGTGPLKFVEWVPQSHIVLERNPGYAWAPEGFHPGPLRFEGVRFTFIREESQRVTALETDETDTILYGPPRDVPHMESLGFQTLMVEVAGIATVCIVNSAKPPTDELAVRQAIQHATNQQSIIDIVFDGVGEALHNVISPGVWGYDESVADRYEYDPEKAIELLEEAGWMDGSDGIRERDGERLEILWIHFPGRTPGVPELMQAQLREVGFDMEIIALDNPGNMERARAGEHNLEWMTWASQDPTILRTLFHSEHMGDGWNYAFYEDARLDELLDLINTTVDLDERREIVREVQQIIIEQALVLPLHVDLNVVMMSQRTEGLEVIGFQLIPYNVRIVEG